ncbi:Type III secretion thermoregulatory protein LcrF/VirF [Chromobacterium vaccinii]|nr:Type III secretion thermoregulatory protein LcrF/VirF [Chromobacterium vaccinii]QND90923.1 Type III secretion thermoregulatory protein LcrF/VirF [Chromobacterium vaccinii]
MTEIHVLHPLQTLEAVERREIAGQQVWLVLPLSGDGVQLELNWQTSRESWMLPAAWQGLLLLDRLRLSVKSGRLRFHAVRLEPLAKLLAFIDEAHALAPVNEAGRCGCLLLDDLSIWSEKRRCEYWFLRQLLEPTEPFATLLALLRRNESYWLVRFLLSNSECGGKLQMLGDRYGVSSSHFRRLCRLALGNAAKTTLRDWRAARSLLDAVESKESLTRLALKHGYASAAHFSNEIKDLYGVSPRALSNLIQLTVK